MQRFSFHLLVTTSACACALALSCATSVTPRPDQTYGVANTQPQEDVVFAERAAHARCDYALACGEVGRLRPFASRDACLAMMRARAREELNPSKACDRAPSPERVDRCIGAIRDEACGDPKGDFVHYLPCRYEELCR